MEGRRRQLDEIEQHLPSSDDDDPLQRVFRRLDAIQEMVRRREQLKGGCIIGNLSTALCDTHDAFRQRLAECFDEMALEFKPHLDAAAQRYCSARQPDTWGLSRYIVSILEGSIMLTRARLDHQIMIQHFLFLKEYLAQQFRSEDHEELSKEDAPCRD